MGKRSSIRWPWRRVYSAVTAAAALMCAATGLQGQREPAQAPVVVGAHRSEVIRLLGEPTGHAVAGIHETLIYPAGKVLLERGRVTQIDAALNAVAAKRVAHMARSAAPPKSAVAAPRSTAPPRVAPAPSSPPVRPKTTQQYVRQPVQPAAPVRLSPVFLLLLGLAAGIVIPIVRILNHGRTHPVSTKQSAAGGPKTGPAEPVSEITLEAVDELEWKRVEELTAAYFAGVGYRAVETDFGPDGGVDVKLYHDGQETPVGYVQCKAWHGDRKVGVKEVRELRGVIAAEGVPEAFFVATGGFTDEARVFAQGQGLTLIDGPNMVARLAALSGEDRRQIIERVWRDDYRTPTCPSCGRKMVLRGAVRPFWGCRSFPRCRSKIPCRRG